MKCGAPAVSPNVSRICRIQKLSPCSKSTNVSSHQTRSRISLRVTTSPLRRTSNSRTRNGCGGSFTRSPCLRSSPEALSSSKASNRRIFPPSLIEISSHAQAPSIDPKPQVAVQLALTAYLRGRKNAANSQGATSMTLRINDVTPDFQAETTQGPISFHEWLGNSWCV